ncbi:calpain-B [Anabrus simplex]|uniref:calpain-B n=1 Tax=Anabrus simplex TaxID=316456 RepID=UPI0035A2A71C
MPYRYGKTIVYKYGERGSGLPPRGSVQDFYKLRDNCLDNGTLFEDRNFVADSSSIYYSKTPDRPLKWRRPHEIVDDPLLFVDGPSRFDIMQGELGNCWLLAAMANLTLHKHLFYQVVPDDQGYKYKYAGIFHFRFWQYGRWVDVVIDDKLPTVYGKLLFLHSSQNNEFWSALLEKAYAKIHGSYEALKEGTTGEAMEDFTGGITEMFDLTHILPNLYQIMLKAYQRTSLMACAIEADPHIVEAMTPEGLVKGHAYSITMVKSFNDTNGSTGKVHLIRLRNPWGNKVEWNGPWSDTSREWRLIPEHIKEEIGLIFDTDGEFWMSFEDFKRHFSVLEICSLNPDCLQDVTLACDKKQWEMSMYEGEWVRGVTAGGCRNFLETFSHNPQYQITLEEIDEDDDENKCTVVIALMQKNRRSQKMMGVEVLSIGFVCYHLEDPDKLPKPLGKQFFKYNKTAGRSPSFVNLREVNSRFKFPPGVYCIVPSTFEPDEEGEFILRVFSENKHNLK